MENLFQRTLEGLIKGMRFQLICEFIFISIEGWELRSASKRGYVNYLDEPPQPRYSVPIGDQHHVEIPDLMPKSEYFKLQKNSYDIVDDSLKHYGVLAQETNRDKGLYPTTATTMPWTEKEESYFIAGLYIFDKDFSAVKRFMGNKTMGEVLSFYYEKIHKSSEYRRWKGFIMSLNNKNGKQGKSKKPRSQSNSYIFAERIICEKTLMSRLKSLLTTDAYLKIIETSWLYGESIVTLEDYLSVLKNQAGLDNFVEALGIGKKGEEDLIGNVINTKRSKNKDALQVPVGKDWASLTQREILYFARKSSSLSKDQSNDLFWEAVWPRLHVKGWQFEKDHASSSFLSFSSSKLFFFVPGVEKFSKKLKRGKHYFNSVSEMLRKVCYNHKLVELAKTDTIWHDKAEEAISSGLLAANGHHADDAINDQNHGACNPIEKESTVADSIMYSSGINTQDREIVLNTERNFARTRLPTIKLLEALAFEEEYLYPKEKRKKRKKINFLL
ncbi:hypothetical protein PIB30_072983 [Stylosanthes scabra]|uniref:SANT domain-containing protein n=1 Tax=Stylosanthes scabra TaxID=79078 RepID=A0ABU6VN81_9FABA|nr:hypothetical protein [Stylosanthes scabra]